MVFRLTPIGSVDGGLGSWLVEFWLEAGFQVLARPWQNLWVQESKRNAPLRERIAS